MTLVLTDVNGKQFDSGDAATGERALKIALLILARRHVLAAGDVLRMLAPG